MGIDCEGDRFGWRRLLLRGGVETDPVQGIEDITQGILTSGRVTSGTEATLRQTLCVVSDELRDTSKVVVAALCLHRGRRCRWCRWGAVEVRWWEVALV